MSETLIVTLTLTTLVSFLALLVGGVIGWVAREHSYETTPQTVYTHPEMFDENGNLTADEILAVRFENYDNTEDDEEDQNSRRNSIYQDKKIVKRVKLPPNPFIHEILELVEEQKTKAKKIDILREYRDDSLTAILIWNFDDSVVSAVPEGQVPYKENEVPVGTDHTSLRREWKNLFHFIKGGNDSLSALRRETMFIQMLEGLHPDEAKIICLVKDKNLTEKYKLTQDIVAEAFPDIKWSDRS